MSEVKYTEAEIEKIKDRILEALEMVIDPELGIDYCQPWPHLRYPFPARLVILKSI